MFLGFPAWLLLALIAMPSMLLTCPDAAHLVEIDYEDSEYGMLLTGCSRFHPQQGVSCDRACTARLDQKKRRAACGEEVTGVYGEETLVSIRR